MKIVIITQNEIFYLPFYFKILFAELDREKFEVDSIVILPAFNESVLKLARRMFRFYGMFDFCRLGLKYAILKFVEKANLLSNNVRALARKYLISIEEPNNVNSHEFIKKLKQIEPDLIVSVAASQIFKEEVLNIPKYGCVNIHCANLPSYRGMMPNFWAMYHGDKTAGITIHTMDKEIDKGKIIIQKQFEIHPKDTLDSLIKRAKIESARLTIQVIEMFYSGKVQYKDYPDGGSYFSFPTAEDVKEFKKRGNKLL